MPNDSFFVLTVVAETYDGIMDNDETKSFDFFSARANGSPPEKQRITSSDGTMRTVKFVPGIVENFEFGWNLETTYGLYRRRAAALLALAEIKDVVGETRQALLSSVIVLVASGLESLVRTAARLKRDDNLSQTIDDFIKAVEQLEGYVPLDGKDRAPLGLLLQVRHAIVHNGWRVTPNVQGKVSGRMPVQEELRFCVGNVRAIIEAADRFAECVAPVFPRL